MVWRASTKENWRYDINHTAFFCTKNSEKKSQNHLQINFPCSTFVVQKVPQTTARCEGWKGNSVWIRNSTCCCKFHSLWAIRHLNRCRSEFLERESILSHSLPLTAGPLGRRDRGSKSEDLPCVLDDLDSQVYELRIKTIFYPYFITHKCISTARGIVCRPKVNPNPSFWRTIARKAVQKRVLSR